MGGGAPELCRVHNPKCSPTPSPWGEGCHLKMCFASHSQIATRVPAAWTWRLMCRDQVGFFKNTGTEKGLCFSYTQTLRRWRPYAQPPSYFIKTIPAGQPLCWGLSLSVLRKSWGSCQDHPSGFTFWRVTRHARRQTSVVLVQQMRKPRHRIKQSTSSIEWWSQEPGLSFQAPKPIFLP